MPRPPAEGFGAIPGMTFRSDFQISVPESAFSATIVEPATGRYITLPTTIGVTVYPFAGTPRSYVQAFASRLTLAGVIWVSGENFIPPGSCPTLGQSVARFWAATPAPAMSARAVARNAARFMSNPHAGTVRGGRSLP